LCCLLLIRQQPFKLFHLRLPVVIEHLPWRHSVKAVEMEW
jgi:hypothetical protein